MSYRPFGVIYTTFQHLIAFSKKMDRTYVSNTFTVFLNKKTNIATTLFLKYTIRTQ